MGELLGAWDVRDDSWWEPEERRAEREEWLNANDITTRFLHIYRAEFTTDVEGNPRMILYQFDSKDGKRYLNPDRKAARAIPVEIDLDELPPEFHSRATTASQDLPA